MIHLHDQYLGHARNLWTVMKLGKFTSAADAGLQRSRRQIEPRNGRLGCFASPQRERSGKRIIHPPNVPKSQEWMQFEPCLLMNSLSYTSHVHYSSWGRFWSPIELTLGPQLPDLLSFRYPPSPLVAMLGEMTRSAFRRTSQLLCLLP